MRCTSPRTVGFQSDGKTISWSQKTYSKEFATFQLPCGKCIECRLDYARQWAIRCVHEAQMYVDNSFITLTYNEENYSDKLYYAHFQLFAKRLRKKIFSDFIKKFGQTNWDLLSKDEQKQHYDKIRIGIFVTGEYGDKKKRPHWHACIFNWRPHDAVFKYQTDRGDKVYESQTLTELWGKGIAEFGSVTLESAGYCARYAAKKLVHGNDQDHDYQPISKKSSKQAIGKKWLEKFWPDVFNYGHIVLPNGETCAIPRYYEKWLQKHKPKEWSDYVTRTKKEKIDAATARDISDRQREIRSNEERRAQQGYLAVPQVTRNEARKKIKESKFKQLMQMLKL